MTAGARALLFGTIFFATCGVALWAVTLPSPLDLLAACGWTLVLVKAHQWESSTAIVDRAQRAGGQLRAFPAPLGRTDVVQVREDYRLNHDVRDLLTLPCRYGCKEPVTCPFPHSDCPHCLAARDEAGLIGRGDAGAR